MDRKNTSCEVFSEDFKRYLPIGISSTALLSLAACSVVAILLLCQKMYCAFHHRIILYLLLYTILADASYMLRIVGAFSLTKSGDFNPVFCSISGFLNEYTDLAQLLIQTIVTVHVGCMVLLIEVRCTRPLGHHYLGITTAHETESSSCKAKRYMRRLELVYALSPAVLPLLFAWIPFVTGDYGKAGIWCWMKHNRKLQWTGDIRHHRAIPVMVHPGVSPNISKHYNHHCDNHCYHLEVQTDHVCRKGYYPF